MSEEKTMKSVFKSIFGISNQFRRTIKNFLFKFLKTILLKKVAFIAHTKN